ncbi:MAG: 2,3-bisphosphoglycerate-independent phosphoglycerate mutase [Xanthomonadales bacterium]|nr:2,3-bisphosphoglycerate-independent phosphoglycerate mutase [Xanthomonadales bacterium]
MTATSTSPTPTHPRPRPLVLMILDGWGYREESDHNAIALANAPNWDRLCHDARHALIHTSGESVGLPAGQMGNSEVGHMNIGAGRIVYQDFTRIDQAIEDGSFFDNPVLTRACDRAREAGGTVHIMGLLSPGGVHSHENQFFAAIRLAAMRGAPVVAVHAFLDGRDTPPRSALASIERLQALVDELPGATIASVTGRYYAMDRDQRWNRTEQAYRAIAHGQSEWQATSAERALSQAYARDENDEFVKPTVIRADDETPGATVNQGDCVIFINFRADRARQLSRAFVEEPFEGFDREKIGLADFVCMTEYLSGLPASVAFPDEGMSHLLGQELSKHGLSQLRIAETEKYAHVTFFMNGGEETPFENEHRILVPSPDVATYDLQPEMSAPELTRRLVEAIHSGTYDVIICNVANPDMVGHSGKLDAAIKAVEAVDLLLGAVRKSLEAVGGELMITADHGNVEQMNDESTGQAHTAHTTNPVPFLFLGREAEIERDGALRDIAPTMLYLLGLPQPEEMTGHSLLRTR